MVRKAEWDLMGKFPSMRIFLVLSVVIVAGIFISLGLAIAALMQQCSCSSPLTSPTSLPYVGPQSIGGLTVDPHLKTITISGGKSGCNLTVNCGHGLSSSANLVTSNSSFLQYAWPQQNIALSVNLQTTALYNEYQIKWTTRDPNRDYLEDFLSFGSGHWFGGAEMFIQKWPIESINHSIQPYITNDIFSRTYGNVQERYWISSEYFGVSVPDVVPLWIGMNNGLILHAQYTDSQYYNFVKSNQAFPYLSYSIYTPVDSTKTSLKDFHLTLLRSLFDLPADIPDKRMMSDPIWSTWARYKKPINQTTVLTYAKEINDHNFTNSQLEIDDEWATHYGDLTMDPLKFPDPKSMTDQLKSMGFRSTIWVHPFSNVDSVTTRDKSNIFYWVQQRDSTPSNPMPVFENWWDGVGVAVDSTNPQASQWFINRLKNFLNTTGIDSYKFDAGETNWLSNRYKLHAGSSPNQYSRSYAEMVSNLGNMIEIRVGSKTQKLANFVRILDRDSNWSYDNGLASVIPATLLFGLLGYPFVLPDMVGGNAYNGSDISAKLYPDRELYTRWVQLNALLPAIQFSITPWDYTTVSGDPTTDVTSISLSCMQIRSHYATLMQQLAVNATQTGEPIIRPMWWTGDESELALTTSDQFMLGDDVIVAPVIESGVTSRMVYFPPGKWMSPKTNKAFNGNGKLQSVNADLLTLPYFVRQS